MQVRTHGFLLYYFSTVKPNIKPTAVQVVVKWNRKNDSKCFADVRDVVC